MNSNNNNNENKYSEECYFENLNSFIDANKNSCFKLFDKTHTGIWIIDKDNNTFFINESLSKMLEATPSEMQGSNILEWIDKENHANFDTLVQKRKEGMKEHHYFEFITKNKHKLSVRMATTPLIDFNKNYIGAMAIILDVEELKQMLQDEKDQKGIVASVAAINGMILFEFKVANDKIIFKDGIKNFLGYEKKMEEFPETIEEIKKIIHPDDLPLCEQMFLQALKEKKIFEHEFRIRHLSIRYINVRIVAHFHKYGNTFYMGGIFQDQTDKYEWLEKMEESGESAINSSLVIQKIKEIEFKNQRLLKLLAEKNANIKQKDEYTYSLKSFIEKVEQGRDDAKKRIFSYLEGELLPLIKKVGELSTNLANEELTKVYELLLEKAEWPLTIDFSTFYTDSESVASLLVDLGTEVESDSEGNHPIFSGIQRKILQFVKKGMKAKEIAANLHISEHTVYTHLRRIRKKLKLQNKSITLRRYLKKQSSPADGSEGEVKNRERKVKKKNPSES
ncbi:MAG: PAS domain S-box protein [Oligoflexia bacterium]|nr:PAS domain S-box protein [Oligoflexia bacterium]